MLHRGQRDKELSYHSGGAGYVLSRKALKMIGDNAVSVLQKSGTVEDVEMGRTMVKLGITCEDTRDETGMHSLFGHGHGFPPWMDFVYVVMMLLPLCLLVFTLALGCK